MALTPEQWKKIDDNIRKAETLKRKELITQKTSLDGDVLSDSLDDQTKSRLADMGLVFDLETDITAITNTESLDQEQAELIGDLEKSLISLRWKNLSQALKNNAALDKKYDELVNIKTKILKEIITITDSGKIPTAERQLLEKINNYLETIDTKKESVKQQNPESWYGLHLKELKDLKSDLQSGKIIETEYVQKQSEDIMSHLMAGQPVFIHGHLGSGKTELAMHVARKMLEHRNNLIHTDEKPDGTKKVIDKRNALILSGSKHTSLSELYGHQTLALGELDTQESELRRKKFDQTLQLEFAEWESQDNNSVADDSTKNRAYDRIKSGLLAQLESEYAKGTITDFYMGPVYKAMEEGRPVILDEVNAIPHEILISLNHLLTRKPGDRITIQQDSGKEITVQEGFGFILTGNLNTGGHDNYIGRQDLDPAFLSRLYKMEHQYLPQATEGRLEEAHIKNESGYGNELFEIIMARVMDKHGNMEIPKGEIRKLWNLAKAARSTQDVFAGINTNSAFYLTQGSQSFPYRLKEGVLSIRGIDKIITAWQSDGMSKEIDYYIYKEFIGSVSNVQDRAFLYQVFHDQFDFFTSNGWNQSPDYGQNGKVVQFSVPVPENKAPAMEFMGPRDTVDVLFGADDIPERTEFPQLDESYLVQVAPEVADIIETEKVNNLLEQLQEFEQFGNTVNKKIIYFENHHEYEKIRDQVDHLKSVKQIYDQEYNNAETSGNLVELKNSQISIQSIIADIEQVIIPMEHINYLSADLKSAWSFTSEMTPTLKNPSDLDWNELIKKSQEQSMTLGEFTLNPETLNLDFDKIKPVVINKPEWVGKKLGEVFAEVIRDYSATHYIPGYDYIEWLNKHPDKHHDILDKTNYFYTPATVIGLGSGNGGVSCTYWLDDLWGRVRRNVEGDWYSNYRVLLLPR